MKINFLVLVVFLSALQLKAQSQKPNDFNGWHFLQWQSDKNADEKLLKENGIEIQDAYSDAAYDRITRFHYEDMNTWLYFDSLFHLSHIDQQKDFSVVEREKADIFFGKTKKIFIQKYGEPNTEDNDTINKITTST